jgi:hypothetical protein
LSYPQAILSIRADQPITIFIDQYSDAFGTIQYPTISYTRTANQGFNQAVNIAGNYFRIRITNTGISATINLFAETWLGILPPLPQLDNVGAMPVNISQSGTLNQVNTTITTGGTAQVALAANPSRTGFEIINTSGSLLYINFSGTATNTSIPLFSGGGYSRYTGKIPTNAVSILGATTGQTFIVLESN